MKNFLKKVVLFLLKKFAKRRLKKFKGKIIAVTGSIGKTSTKDAIFAVLNSQFKVKAAQKSMNSEFGLLLTILEIDSGFSSAYKWSWLLIKAFYYSLLKNHNEVLLVELGVDAPGNMDFLLSIIKPDIAVMTNVFPVHLGDGQFVDLDAVFAEKRKLIDALSEDGIAVLNLDNPYTSSLAQERPKKTTKTFGKDRDCGYRAGSIKLSTDGLKFILHKGEERYEVNSKVLGEYHIYVLMPAIICGELMGMSTEDSILALHRYSLPPGRMTIIPGIEDSVILDSSYNSSPEPLKEALGVLKEIGINKRKVAVLGNMNELGETSEVLHEMVGKIIPNYADFLITVGEEAKIFAKKALEKDMKEENVHSFENAKDAAEFYKKAIKKGDILLVKGSQNRVRLERFIKEFMLHPEDAEKLLVRQEKVWKDIV